MPIESKTLRLTDSYLRELGRGRKALRSSA